MEREELVEWREALVQSVAWKGKTIIFIALLFAFA